MARHEDDLDKRQRILAAAERLFVGRRFHEVTTDEVAQEAQVSKGTIYRYFQDKDDLLFQMVTAGFDPLCEQIEAMRDDAAAADAFPGVVLRACEAISQFFQHRRRVIHMFQAEETRAMASQGKAKERWEQRRARLLNALASLIEQGQHHHAIRSDYPATTLAAMLLGMMRARARDTGHDNRPPMTVPHVVTLFFQGAAPGSAPAPGTAAPGRSTPTEPPSGGVPPS